MKAALKSNILTAACAARDNSCARLIQIFVSFSHTFKGYEIKDTSWCCLYPIKSS